MEAKTRKTRMVLGLALIISFGIIGLLLNQMALVKDNLDKEKIKSTNLLIEKSKLDETLASMRGQIATLTDKNVQLDKIVKENNKLLMEKDLQIKRLEVDNAMVAELRKSVGILESTNEKLTQDLNQMSSAYASAKNENDKLNNLVASLQGENEMLTLNNTILKSMVVDNYRIEAVRGKNDKLTINAKRADKLVVSFDLPEEIGSGLHFQVITPRGEVLSSLADGSAFIQTSDQPEYLLASISSGSVSFVNKRTEMVYKPEGKLQQGIYTFNIYNKEVYLGSIQLKLR